MRRNEAGHRAPVAIVASRRPGRSAWVVRPLHMTKRERQLVKVMKYKQMLVKMDTPALIQLHSSPGVIEVAAIAARQVLEERGVSVELSPNKEEE